MAVDDEEERKERKGGSMRQCRVQASLASRATLDKNDLCGDQCGLWTSALARSHMSPPGTDPNGSEGMCALGALSLTPLGLLSLIQPAGPQGLCKGPAVTSKARVRARTQPMPSPTRRVRARNECAACAGMLAPWHRLVMCWQRNDDASEREAEGGPTDTHSFQASSTDDVRPSYSHCADHWACVTCVTVGRALLLGAVRLRGVARRRRVLRVPRALSQLRARQGCGPGDESTRRKHSPLL